MSGMKAIRVATAAVVLLFAPAAAEETSPVREMMIVSGMVEEFADLGETFRAGFLQSAAQYGLPSETAKEFGDVAARRMDGEDYLAEIEAGLELTLTPDEVAAIAAFYRTPLGVRLKQADVASSTPEAQLEIQARRAEILAELEADPERLEFARAFEKELRAAELSATIAVSVARSIVIGAAQSDSRLANSDALAAVEGQLTAMRGRIVEDMRESLVATLGWSYRDFTDEELATYADFLKSDASRAAYAVIFEVTHRFASERSRKIGEEFGALMRQKKT